MFQKIACLFSVVVGGFLCTVAAALDNGSNIDHHPGVAILLIVGMGSAFAGSILLRARDPRDWGGKGFAGMIIAAIAAVAVLMHNPWIWALNAALFTGLSIWILRLKLPQSELAC